MKYEFTAAFKPIKESYLSNRLTTGQEYIIRTEDFKNFNIYDGRRHIALVESVEELAFSFDPETLQNITTCDFVDFITTFHKDFSEDILEILQKKKDAKMHQ